MRQNLTNVKETQLDKVDSFYIVGSTTKEGLIEGRSNVKIDLKKAVAEGGGGGGSEDAQKLFEMFFGQVPYVYVMGTPLAFTPKLITECSTEELAELCNEYGGGALIYKEHEPISGAYSIKGSSSVSGIDVTVLSGVELEMTPVPVDIPNGPWYYPTEKADVDLSDFPMPTDGNPTILTGVEIPQKEELTVKSMHGTKTYNWNSGANQYKLESPEGLYIIAYDENVWVWSFYGRIG